MKLDLSKMILEGSTRRNSRDDCQVSGVTKQYTVEPEFKVFKTVYGDYEVLHKEPIVLEAVNMGDNKVHISGNVSLVLGIPCSRCLETVPTDIDFSISLELNLGDSADLNDIEEDQSFVDGRIIDIDGMLYPEIFMNLPSKVLCKEECRGICRVCGKNLNEGECGCDTFVPDPRMAAINDIFKDFNNN
ncbi:MAG: YceD family protein [Butyrivibrio sp.]